MWRRPSGSATTIAANRHCSAYPHAHAWRLGAAAVRERVDAVKIVNDNEVHATLSARSAAVEESVRQAYASTLEPKFPSGLTLLSVGGFGRRELFPHSDVDLLILIDADLPTAAVKERLSVFLQTLWDSGLRPSHSVHTVADCVTEQEQNAELTISLLDRRWRRRHIPAY